MGRPSRLQKILRIFAGGTNLFVLISGVNAFGAHRLPQPRLSPSDFLAAAEINLGRINEEERGLLLRWLSVSESQSPTVRPVSFWSDTLSNLWGFPSKAESNSAPPESTSDTLWCVAASSFVGKMAYCKDTLNRAFTLSGINVGMGIAATLMRLTRVQEKDSPEAKEDFPGNYTGYMGDAGYYIPGLGVPVAGGMAVGLLQKTTSTNLLSLKLNVTGFSVAPLPFANVNTDLTIRPTVDLWP